jgi:hypothetical protein
MINLLGFGRNTPNTGTGSKDQQFHCRECCQTGGATAMQFFPLERLPPAANLLPERLRGIRWKSGRVKIGALNDTHRLCFIRF